MRQGLATRGSRGRRREKGEEVARISSSRGQEQVYGQGAGALAGGSKRGAGAVEVAGAVVFKIN